MQSSFKKHKKQGFSMVELLVAVTVVAVLSMVAYLGVQTARDVSMNSRVRVDLIAITNALEQYKQDHSGKYPVPPLNGTMNVNCFYADATYAHDCDSSSFRQAMIDTNLLGKRYLQEVPTDPRTGGRYTYGVTNDGRFFQVAGLYNKVGAPVSARVRGNLGKGFHLPSIIRSYNGPNFVVDRGQYLPYSPNGELTAMLKNPVGGGITINNNKTVSYVLTAGDVITTDADSETDIYFSDGSVSHLEPSSTLTLSELSFGTNNADSTDTHVRLKLTAGKIWNKVVRLASQSQFRVETTNAIAGVRGTEFGVITDGTDDTFVVDSGKLDVNALSSGEPTGTVTKVDATSSAQEMTVTNGVLGTPTDSMSQDSQTFIDDNQAPVLNGQVTPYIIALVIPPVSYSNSTTFTADVGMNSPVAGDYRIDGWDIYRKSQFEDERKLVAEAVPDDTLKAADFTYDANDQLYRLTIAFDCGTVNTRCREEGVVVQAFRCMDNPTCSSKIYSNLSWPPIGFDVPSTSTDTYRPDFTENYTGMQNLSGLPPGAVPSPRLKLTAPAVATVPAVATSVYFNADLVLENYTGSGEIYSMNSQGCTISAPPSPPSTVDANGVSIGINASSAGSCVLTATANINGVDLTEAVTVDITKEDNLAPTGIIEVKNSQGDVLGTTEGATTIPTVQVIKGDTITLDASASRDPNAGDTLSYSWYTVDSSGSQTPLNKITASITVDTSVVGSTTYRVRVFDGKIRSTKDIILKVVAGNVAPTAMSSITTSIGSLAADSNGDVLTLTAGQKDDIESNTSTSSLNVVVDAGDSYDESTGNTGSSYISQYIWSLGTGVTKIEQTPPSSSKIGLDFALPAAGSQIIYNYSITVVDNDATDKKSNTLTKLLTVVVDAPKLDSITIDRLEATSTPGTALNGSPITLDENTEYQLNVIAMNDDGTPSTDFSCSLSYGNLSIDMTATNNGKFTPQSTNTGSNGNITCAGTTETSVTAQIAVNVNSATPTLAGLCTGTDTWYDSTNGECWVVGTAGDSCDTACNSIGSVGNTLSCVADDSATTGINEGNWNVNSSICASLGLTYDGSSGSVNFLPTVDSAGTKCIERNIVTNQNCSISTTGVKRICACN